MNATSGQNFTSVLNCLHKDLLRSVGAIIEPVDVFEQETSVKLVKILVQEPSQSNHMSPEPPFFLANARPCQLRRTGGTRDENGIMCDLKRD